MNHSCAVQSTMPLAVQRGSLFAIGPQLLPLYLVCSADQVCLLFMLNLFLQCLRQIAYIDCVCTLLSPHTQVMSTHLQQTAHFHPHSTQTLPVIRMAAGIWISGLQTGCVSWAICLCPLAALYLQGSFLQ